MPDQKNTRSYRKNLPSHTHARFFESLGYVSGFFLLAIIERNLWTHIEDHQSPTLRGIRTQRGRPKKHNPNRKKTEKKNTPSTTEKKTRPIRNIYMYKGILLRKKKNPRLTHIFALFASAWKKPNGLHYFYRFNIIDSRQTVEVVFFAHMCVFYGSTWWDYPRCTLNNLTVALVEGFLWDFFSVRVCIRMQ